MKQYTQNNFLAYLIILGAFFILIFFTKNIYTETQIKNDTLESVSQQLEGKKEELSRLKTLQQELENPESEAVKNIIGFSGAFSDENIINHIYAYAQKINLGDDRVIIRNISFGKQQESDLGFNKVNLNLKVLVSSESTLFSLFNYLTDIESNYRFYITNFNYELGESQSNISVDIPLTFYYK